MRSLLIALALSVVLSAPAAGVTRQRPIMSTVITVILPDAPDPDRAAEAVFAAFAHVEAVLNEWRKGSPIAQLNEAAGGAPVPLAREVLDILARGKTYGELTRGAFDITWAACWQLWDFKARVPHPPSAAKVTACRRLVDYRSLEVHASRGTARLPRAGMAVGLGGMVKGTASDLAVKALAELGVTNYAISAGGQVTVSGHKEGRLWRVGIRDPRGDPEDSFAMLETTGVTTATSGDYEHYFMFGGRRYHHILDPRTGLPARGVRSATGGAPDPTDADVLATAMVVLGVKAGLALLAGRPGVEAVLVDDAGKVHHTPGLEGRLKIIHPPR